MDDSIFDPGEASLEQITDLFRLLSDKTWLNILLLLREREPHVSSLCERLRLPQPTVSHHLGLLRMNNLIDNRRSGKQVYYGLSGRFVPDPGAGMLSFRANGFQVKLDLRKKDE